MKKNIAVAVMAVFMFVQTFVASAYAGTVTNMPNWGSKALLLMAAIENARTVQTWCGATTQMSNNTSYATILSSDHNSEDILSAVTAAPLSLTVANPNDWVYVGAQVLDQNGQVLLYGSAAVKPVNGPGGYSLPQIGLELVLSSQIAVKFDKPIRYAELLYVDPKTHQSTFSRQVYGYGNTVYVPTDGAGSSYLVLYVEDGTKRYYDLTSSDGRLVDGTAIEASITSASIPNLQPYKDPTSISGVVWSENGIGDNQVFEVIMTSGQQQQFNVTLETSERYKPIGIWVRKQGDTGNGNYIDGKGASDIPVSIGSGTWYIIPVWNEDEFRSPDPVPPYYGGVGEKS